LILGLVPAFALAQSSPVSCGGNGEGADGSFSYTFGQTFYHETGWNVTFSEGIQQPYEISITRINDNIESIDANISISAYPNPTMGQISLLIEGVDLQGLEYNIVDVLGRIVISGEIVSAETLIDISSQPLATYLLRVMRDGNDLGTFKVVKK